MAELDPYAVLGVPRTATREEIARAYRRLAKLHHPDAGGPASPTMARINEAWSVLSSASRRARWDADHAVVHPAHWAAAPPAPRESVRPRPSAPAGPASVRDSGWLAAAVGGFVILLVMVAAGVLISTGVDEPDAQRIELGSISLVLPDGWRAFEGDGSDTAGHRVLAHITSYEISDEERCRSFEDTCPITPETVPPDAVSLLITEWDAGTPPIPDPILSRPFGRDAERIIGGEPAAFELRRLEDGAIAWWQLSPPGFPDRWIEVEAFLGGGRFDQDRSVRDIDGMLAFTLRFVDP
jgi:curved DNA-binding protein CbpA